ncbi:MAG: hypothetical protein ACRDT8_15065 [Micromonosporaceae bacterium]
MTAGNDDGPHTGRTLAGDLVKLLGVAREDVPALAEAYLSMNDQVADTAVGDKSAFIRQGHDVRGGNADTPGIVYPAWRALRDEFQRILGESATNLMDIGDALELAVKLYSETDQEAADKLKRLIADDPLPKRRDLPEPQMPEQY